MKINIKDRDIELKYTFRAHILYENITGENFAPTGLTSIINFYYSTIMANDRDINLEYDEFLDFLDANPETLKEFSGWLVSNIKKDEDLTQDSTKKNTSKSKKKA